MLTVGLKIVSVIAFHGKNPGSAPDQMDQHVLIIDYTLTYSFSLWDPLQTWYVTVVRTTTTNTSTPTGRNARNLSFPPWLSTGNSGTRTSILVSIGTRVTVDVGCAIG